jgi:hypothetical protein
MLTKVDLYVFAVWKVMIPSSLTDNLDYENKESLIKTLHDHGARDVIDHSGFVVTYDVETKAEAFQLCKLAIDNLFISLLVEQEMDGEQVA